MTTKRRMLRVTAWSCTCERCGHRWQAIGKAAPTACAKCKSRYWNTARGTLKRGPRPKG